MDGPAVSGHELPAPTDKGWLWMESESIGVRRTEAEFAHTCGAQYTRPGGRQRGDRLVVCDRPAEHEDAHMETATETTWPSVTQVEGLGARYVAVKHSAAYHERRANQWRTRAHAGWALALAGIVLLWAAVAGWFG